jgi:hypothetical protein
MFHRFHHHHKGRAEEEEEEVKKQGSGSTGPAQRSAGPCLGFDP